MFAMNVVYFLDPLEEYLKEFCRVLKPGGTITLGCKFGPLVKTDEFINVEQEPIVTAMEQAGLRVDVKVVNPEQPNNWTSIKGTK